MSVITAIEIEQYKGFYSRQRINFALPNGKQDGSGLTIITGPNNSGKTTVIEALTIGGPNKSFKMSERHEAKKPIIKIITSEGWTQYSSLGDGSIIEKKEYGNPVFAIDPISSRRGWNAEFAGDSNMDTVRQQAMEDLKRTDLPIAQSLSAIRKDPVKYKKLSKMMKRLIPHFTKWDIDTLDNNNRVIKYYSGGNTSHVASLLGEGIISLFRVCAAFIDTNPATTILIDEPEISLHPSAQKKLRLLLSELSKSLQIIVCTHSPYFLDWQDFSNGAEFLRLNKHGDRKCTIHTLDHRKDYSIHLANNIKNWQKPHILDTVTKEVFFAEKVLVLEGQQDVGIIKKWLNETGKEVDFEIFGYGAGGETEIPLYLNLCRDLGIKKVAGVFDANATKYNDCKKNFPGYRVYKLSTDDIVDKKKTPARVCVIGTFDTKAELKDSYRQDFLRKFQLLSNFFAS